MSTWRGPWLSTGTTLRVRQDNMFSFLLRVGSTFDISNGL